MPRTDSGNGQRTRDTDTEHGQRTWGANTDTHGNGQGELNMETGNRNGKWKAETKHGTRKRKRRRKTENGARKRKTEDGKRPDRHRSRPWESSATKAKTKATARQCTTMASNNGDNRQRRRHTQPPNMHVSCFLRQLKLVVQMYVCGV